MSKITDAIAHVPGGVPALAAALGVSTNFVYQMARGERPVPAKRCVAIVKACGHAVTAHDLRPDVFPEETKAAS